MNIDTMISKLLEKGYSDDKIVETIASIEKRRQEAQNYTPEHRAAIQAAYNYILKLRAKYGYDQELEDAATSEELGKLHQLQQAQESFSVEPVSSTPADPIDVIRDIASSKYDNVEEALSELGEEIGIEYTAPDVDDDYDPSFEALLQQLELKIQSGDINAEAAAQDFIDRFTESSHSAGSDSYDAEFEYDNCVQEAEHLIKKKGYGPVEAELALVEMGYEEEDAEEAVAEVVQRVAQYNRQENL